MCSEAQLKICLIEIQELFWINGVIFLSMLMRPFSMLQCEQASGLWKQLELVSRLESDLGDTGDGGRKWLVDFSVGKLNLFILIVLITVVLLM